MGATASKATKTTSSAARKFPTRLPQKTTAIPVGQPHELGRNTKDSTKSGSLTQSFEQKGQSGNLKRNV
jgi:hypothetical protein